MKRKRAKVVVAVLFTAAALAADPAQAHAVPSWCSAIAGAGLSLPDYCYDSGEKPMGCDPTSQVCIPGGTSCSLQLNGCSPIPGKPGTWNPRGYTPCTYLNGCY